MAPFQSLYKRKHPTIQSLYVGYFTFTSLNGEKESSNIKHTVSTYV